MILLAGCNGMQAVKINPPTAVDFGDSVSKAYAAYARFDLYGKVDFRHDPYEKGDIVPANNLVYVETEILYGMNAGYSTTLLRDMEENLVDHTWYNVLVYNSGYHDMQRRPSQPVGTVNISQSIYRNNMEAIAQMAEQHAGIVIWVDTPGLGAPQLPVGSEVVDEINVPVYNDIARDVAKEHGFYMLSMPDTNHDGSVHTTTLGSHILGQRVADCVLTALSNTETSDCHK
jgi:hypothetical protein